MAPNKKYLSLEEAAAQLGIKPDELVRLREKGEVRGFADRGTWKFKADDVAEFRRRRQPDSDPDLQIIDDFGDDNDDAGRQATVIRKGVESKSDSDVRLASDDSTSRKKALSGSSAELPTINLSDSDSDVRLVEAVGNAGQGSDSDVSLFIPRSGAKSDSDSDVRMIDSPDPVRGSKSSMNSDSDVRLSTTDSDIRLSSFSDSDSDVKLIGPKSKGGKVDSDSDVTLLAKNKRATPADLGEMTQDMGPSTGARGDSDFNLAGSGRSDSALLDGDDSSITLAGDSGIQLAGDSGIQLIGGGDSGIRLGASSGIRLGGDSGIRLADDSGLQLQRPADSGISLEGPDSEVRLADSGINLGEDSGIRMTPGSSKTFELKSPSSKIKKGESSKKLKGSARPVADDLDATAPMLLPELSDEDLGATSPLLSNDEDDASASDLEAFDGSDTSELQSMGDFDNREVQFEDEDEDDAPPVATKRKQKTVEESIFEVDEPLEELEVSDEDLSGENEIDDLAFDEDDESLDDSFSTGASQLGFGGSQKVALAQEAEWSAGFCSLLFASLCVLIAGSWVSADLLRTVWASSGDSAVYPGIAGVLSSMWK